jgi:hypothetical protein
LNDPATSFLLLDEDQAKAHLANKLSAARLNDHETAQALDLGLP